MNSTNTSQRELVLPDDAEGTEMDVIQAEKGEEPTKPFQASRPEIPDGGLFAWLQVAGAFCIFLNTWYV